MNEKRRPVGGAPESAVAADDDRHCTCCCRYREPIPRGRRAGYWARRGQTLSGSPTVRYLQLREDIAMSGRILDPREAA